MVISVSLLERILEQKEKRHLIFTVSTEISDLQGVEKKYPHTFINLIGKRAAGVGSPYSGEGGKPNLDHY